MVVIHGHQRHQRHGHGAQICFKDLMRPVNLKTKGTFLIKFSLYFYRPRSIASEGYVFTGACHFNSGGGEEVGDQVTTPPSPPPTHRDYAGVSLALDRWPMATWFFLRATYFWTLLAQIGHLSSESLFY